MTVLSTTVSTAEISPGERIEFWEHWNSSSLVGLRCSTLLADGLRVSARQRAWGDVTFTEIQGDQHTVERSPQALRQRPGDALFVSILTSGSAFFASPGGMIVAHAGESILYSTDQPYLFGFDRAMSQLILTVPMDVAYGDWGLAPADRPRLLTAEQSRGLRAAATAALAGEDEPGPRAGSAGGAAADAISALLLDLGGTSSPLAALRARALAAVRRRLGDPRLAPASLAEELGVSERQLRRAFADGGQSPAAAIQRERLEAARRRLRGDPRLAVSDVAAEFCFASPAHFSRAFRAHHGATPSALRG
ncbi:MAG: AraC family transcriptional regulator [Candidatus Leucobacter sulfamidivorax]|nr:AraC family transcriptional regulator [Candidatus Leucobacter sulfamidivorax]